MKEEEDRSVIMTPGFFNEPFIFLLESNEEKRRKKTEKDEEVCSLTHVHRFVLMKIIQSETG